MRAIKATALAAVLLVCAIALARAQDAGAGDQYLARRVAQDAIAIKQLLDENAQLRAQIEKLKAPPAPAPQADPKP